jgi:hypothetical protein
MKVYPSLMTIVITLLIKNLNHGNKKRISTIYNKQFK